MKTKIIGESVAKLTTFVMSTLVVSTLIVSRLVLFNDESLINSIENQYGDNDIIKIVQEEPLDEAEQTPNNEDEVDYEIIYPQNVANIAANLTLDDSQTDEPEISIPNIIGSNDKEPEESANIEKPEVEKPEVEKPEVDVPDIESPVIYLDILNESNITVDQEQQIRFEPQVETNSNFGIVYTVVNLPSFLNFDETNGTIYGTPQSSDVGSYNVLFTATTKGASETLDLNIVVNKKAYIKIVSSTNIEAYAFNSFNYNPQVETNSTSEVIYSSTNLPGFLTLNKQTGVISATNLNASAGVYKFNYTAKTNNISDTVEITLTVKNLVYLNILNEHYQYGYVDQAFKFTPRIETNSTLAPTYSTSGLPSFLILDRNTGIITGTPRASDVGYYTFDYTVKVEGVSQTVTLYLSVTNKNATANAQQSVQNEQADLNEEIKSETLDI